MKHLTVLFLFCAFVSTSLNAQQSALPTIKNCIESTDLNYIVKDSLLWDTTGVYEVRQSIRILDGARLRISNGVELHFVPGTGIIVEKGGELAIDGSTTLLTTTCRADGADSRLLPWDGINVKGTANSSDQSLNAQGLVTIKDATISYAKVAIEQLGGCTELGGGVIKVDDAIFLNNIIAIRFTEHRNTNASYITGSRFEINDGFMQFGKIERHSLSSNNYDWRLWHGEDGYKECAQVVLKENDGVIITDCDFFNYFSADSLGNATSSPSWKLLDALGDTIEWPNSNRLWSDPLWQGSAIYGAESKFTVKGSNSCTDDSTSGKRNHFIGWYYGVYAFYSNYATETSSVSGSVFTDNKFDIYISHAQNVVIEDNYFLKTNSIFKRLRIVNADTSNSPSAANLYGIYIRERMDDISIINNRFNVNYDTNFGAFSGLVYYADSRFFPNELTIQNNTFFGQVPYHAGSYLQELNVQTVVRLNGIHLFNLGSGTDSTHHFYMDCNRFDFENAGATFNTKKHYERTDLRASKASGNNPVITVESLYNPGSVPLTQWSDYSSQICGTGDSTFISYHCYNIGSDFSFTYPTYTTGTLQDYPDCVDTVHVIRSTAGSAPTDSCPGICGSLESSAPAGSSLWIKELEDQTNESEQKHRELSIYPNPASNNLEIISPSQGTIKIISIDGREVLSSKVMQTGQNKINITSLKAGEYIILYNSLNSSSSQKFIKQ